MIGVVGQILGAALVLLVLVDVYYTVLFARSGSGLVSPALQRVSWRLLRAVAGRFPGVLAHGGAGVLLATVLSWVGVMWLGYALMVWPALGDGIRGSEGATPHTLWTALYVAGYGITTLGTGDIAPHTAPYRMILVVSALTGFSLLTMIVTFVVSVYSALIQRNAFALELHHASGDTGDAAELLARFGLGSGSGEIRSALGRMAVGLSQLLEAHHAYPVLQYFRFPEPYYALARIVHVTLDAATLARSALDADAHPELVEGAAVSQLWYGGRHALVELAETGVPGAPTELPEDAERAWDLRFRRARRRLAQAGLVVCRDVDAGARRYAELRRCWEGYARSFAGFMAYDWDDVAPADTGDAPARERPEDKKTA